MNGVVTGRGLVGVFCGGQGGRCVRGVLICLVDYLPCRHR